MDTIRDHLVSFEAVGRNGSASTPGTSAGRTVSVVIPCLDEAASIAECVERARAALDANGLQGEVLVVDNASDDGSAEIAALAGARVVEEPRRGYGSAYLRGFAEARGDYLVMIDGDLTYDFDEIPRFVEQLDAGADVVMGNRMQNIAPGAMSIVSRIGNPILSGFLNLLVDTGVGDAHCGMRAVRRSALPRLDLRATGMEFASEMVIRAARAGLELRELPIALHPREGESKLSPLRDGWRHLRLILVYSPTAVFLVPGLAMMLLGTLLSALVLSEVSLFGRQFLVHTLIAGVMLGLAGVQVVGLGLCARAYGVYHLGDDDPFLERMSGSYRLEHGLLLGAAAVVSGLALSGIVFGQWVSRGFGTLGEERLAIVGGGLVVAGLQVFFTSFLLSIIGLRRRG